MKIQFSDNDKHLNFAPLTLTRPVAKLRLGMLTIEETWQRLLNFSKTDTFYQTESYLQTLFPADETADYHIAANCKPGVTLIQEIQSLQNNQSLYLNNEWICTKGEKNANRIDSLCKTSILLHEIWDLFQKNEAAAKIDFNLLTKDKQSALISDSNQVMGSENIFVAPGAKIECAILNGNTGPIYIDKDAEVMEGAIIRGPFYLGEHSTVKMGAKIYGATTIGPECKVGGEISNCILQGYSNKGHDGFIGNSVIGEWCNLGADTNSSNLKNNYGKLKIHSYKTKTLVQTDNIFCGVMMGDHSKTGINTMLNTATVIGVSANVFGGGFPPKYIPSFSWGLNDQFKFDKAIEVATNMMKRRNITLSPADIDLLKYLYQTV
ncbi:glucose-1-phosphate thymidylyltransferase [Putridiphycobacter roseus]|uniref:Glucose-1-phosphate thymidylyltransferase n=1 Tax=Putridiphycobacter roseus TaxID=2219161 RepID=A0A2W1MV55_9FLAO|nr:GlmU family protein [Putridiphycobacter roseus]PZE15969.1 glucose-1-phosphate thymidylyltransferase [Putridiphycobacter roseus]